MGALAIRSAPSVAQSAHPMLPNLFYEDLAGGTHLTIYLDGLSKGIHGNIDRHRMDRIIRERLRAVPDCEK